MSDDLDETIAAPGNDETQVAGASGEQTAACAPGTTVDQYHIEGLLGSGGMAQVYRAVDQNLKRTVALKFLHPHLQSNPQVKERFLREGQAVARINHPHVIGIHGIVDNPNHHYMVLEYIDGEDLHEHLTQHGPYSISEAINIIEACCDGLQALHQAGIIHRDIKPHNIFMTKDSVVKIGDLGLAHLDVQDRQLTTSGEMLGTPVFMSPEQVTSDKNIDIRSDIHALGATLYKLLTNKAPFDGDTMYSVCDKIVKGKRPDVSRQCNDADKHLATLITTMMAINPADRYPDPQTLKLAIERYKLGQDPAIASAGTSAAEDKTITEKTAARKTQTSIINRKPLHLAWAAGIGVSLIIILAMLLSGPFWSHTHASAYHGSDRFGHWLDLHIAGERIRFRMIPADQFTIGSPNDEARRSKNEAQHKVAFSTPTWIADRECSVQLWQQLNPASPGDQAGQTVPKTNVSYVEIQGVLEQLNQKISGLGQLRLPTDAEWEVAARAHSSTAYSFGDSLDQLGDYANFADADSDLAWADLSHHDGCPQLAPVASYSPNGWGLYDMHGNVWEWCADAYHDRPGGLISSAVKTDFIHSRGSTRVIRGGSWYEASEYCRSASRRGIDPDTRNNATGFRFALVLSPEQQELITPGAEE